MHENKSICIRVHGKVQGVFFRATAKDRATELRLNGFTRNEQNGSVYIEIEGPPESVDQFVSWCHHGPPRAKVTKVETEVLPNRGFNGFEIQR